jgi:hypothetical protein
MRLMVTMPESFRCLRAAALPSAGSDPFERIRLSRVPNAIIASSSLALPKLIESGMLGSACILPVLQHVSKLDAEITFRKARNFGSVLVLSCALNFAA